MQAINTVSILSNEKNYFNKNFLIEAVQFCQSSSLEIQFWMKIIQTYYKFLLTKFNFVLTKFKNEYA